MGQAQGGNGWRQYCIPPAPLPALSSTSLENTVKTVLIPLLLIAGMNLAQADDTTPTTLPSPDQARATWQAMTPEQQAAAKAMAKSEAQQKQAAWGALTPEEQAAKKAAAQEKMQPYREAMQGRMQARMGSRPFGHR